MIAPKLSYRLHRADPYCFFVVKERCQAGRILGVVKARFLSDPSKVRIEKISIFQRYRPVITVEILRQFERCAKFLRRTRIVLEAAASEMEFYRAHGYIVVGSRVSGGTLSPMQKNLV